MFKVNNGNITRRREKCLKLTIKTPERRHWRHFSVFIVNLEHMSRLVILLLLLTLSRKMPVGNILKMKLLIHFRPLISFYTPYKHQKTKAFLMFSKGIERDQWHETDQDYTFSH